MNVLNLEHISKIYVDKVIFSCKALDREWGMIFPVGSIMETR